GGAHPRYASRDAVFRSVFPWRGAEVQLVRRLSAQPRLPDAGGPVSAGAPESGWICQRTHRYRRCGRRVRQNRSRRSITFSSGVVMQARIDKVVTSGTFELDGGSWEVENNICIVGNDDEVAAIEAAHQAASFNEAVGERRVVALILPHGHNDHSNAAVDVAEATGAPMWLSAADRMLWYAVHTRVPDHLLADST